MEQFVLIPQQLYEQKFKLHVYKLDKSEEKVNVVPQNSDSLHKDITTNTKSFKNESVLDQILKCLESSRPSVTPFYWMEEIQM